HHLAPDVQVHDEHDHRRPGHDQLGGDGVEIDHENRPPNQAVVAELVMPRINPGARPRTTISRSGGAHAMLSIASTSENGEERQRSGTRPKLTRWSVHRK